MGTSKKRHNSGSHASPRVRIGGGSANIADRLKSKNRVFSKGQLTKIKAAQAIIQTPPLTAMDEGDDEDWITQGAIPYDDRMEDVLKGQEVFEPSHEAEWAALLDSYYETTPKKQRRKDRRTRRDRTERRNRRFAPQMEGMTAAYMAWDHEHGKGGLSEGVPDEWEGPMGATTVVVVDFWRIYNADVQANLEGDGLFWSIFLVHNGLFPCSPGVSKVTVTTRTLETFRLLSLRCPRLGIQPFVKALCDLHGVAFRPYLREQLSIAYDLYLDIRARVRDLVMATVGRDSPNWRLSNTCPCCQYCLKHEEPLKFSMLFTMDGNDSLKRVTRRGQGTDSEGNEGGGLGPSKEREDSRQGGGDYFLSREEVDRWARDSIQELFGQKDEDIFNESNGCADRWKNMSEELTSKMWGVFEETGVFVSLCRHGFVLLVVDMVESGELAKYPLAIVNRLLEVLGANLGGGYDIGCRFKATLSTSPLCEQVKSLNYTSLVGLFHGHAHCRLCQLQHLGTYVRGLGLEDLEGCERFFSKSNALASSTCHASSFHRRQGISAYCHHHDNSEMYPNLSTFLVNNYKQALEILNSRGALLVAMQELGVKSFAEFPDWLKKEEAYLQGLKAQPQGEALEIKYFQKLEKLNRAESLLEKAQKEWLTTTPDTFATAPDQTRRIEAQRRHSLEQRNDLKLEVQALELKLGVKERWVAGTAQWERVKRMANMADFQKAVDKLEGLIVARLFELTKMNMSGTGYRLRKHIAQALKTRSKAVRTALEQYNVAAEKCGRELLEWEEVVEYSFLSDFDLLRDSRQDVRQEAWAKPAGRLAMDQYFKILGAREEITRLNIEIRRLVTSIRDEGVFLSSMYDQTLPTNPPLAHQIEKYRLERAWYNHLHMERLTKLSMIEGFTGCLYPGESVNGSPQSSLPGRPSADGSTAAVYDHDEDAPPEEEEERDQGEDQGDIEGLSELCEVVCISED
ncbi:hypothetical protein PQX77_016845 [Marasmius sp. AFHP31]|nr:hypothetical protein PQX77_016845 [Marasmius sp. AFHP31]